MKVTNGYLLPPVAVGRNMIVTNGSRDSVIVYINGIRQRGLPPHTHFGFYVPVLGRLRIVTTPFYPTSLFDGDIELTEAPIPSVDYAMLPDRVKLKGRKLWRVWQVALTANIPYSVPNELKDGNFIEFYLDVASAATFTVNVGAGSLVRPTAQDSVRFHCDIRVPVIGGGVISAASTVAGTLTCLEGEGVGRFDYV